MNLTDPRVLTVRDFILGAGGVCGPCKAAIRREGEFDALLANVLTTRLSEPDPEPKDERIVGTLAAAVLLVIGILIGVGGSFLFGWAK